MSQICSHVFEGHPVFKEHQTVGRAENPHLLASWRLSAVGLDALALGGRLTHFRGAGRRFYGGASPGQRGPREKFRRTATLVSNCS